MLIGDVINKNELSTLVIAELKEHGIKFRKEKKNKSCLEKCCKRIFKMPLEALELTDVVLASGGIVKIPKFVADACQRILEQVETEGLFRKAGSTIRQKEIRIGLEAGLPLGRSHHVIDVANVLKTFFRELPDPLIAPSIQEPMLRCLMAGERGVKPLLMTCLLLPALSANTLAFFMQFLHTVSLCASRNKMTIDNLAILFTPGLMPFADISGIRFTNHVKVVKLLIEQSKSIGVLPENIAKKLSHAKVITPSEGDKKKKKRRSGMFNGLRKIVGVIGSAESLDSTPENEPATPCLTKSAKKRKLADVSAFSAKKKKDLLALFPENGGLLPNTPYSDKETKKTRLSLGGRKSVRTTASSSTDGVTVERRWSMVGPSWSRKKQSQCDLSKRETSNSCLSPVVSMPCLPQLDQSREDTKIGNESGTMKEFCMVDSTAEATDEFVRIPKSEYEAIQERVTAIESRISQEFGSVADCILRTSNADLDSSLSGPEKVLNKFEKTMERTGNITSPQTELLAKRLSRELKIRRSDEHKIIRSPSARKIGTMRRRSRESGKVARNKTWHISNRCFAEGQKQVEAAPIAIPFYPKSNLKRGRPNTVFTGLHQPSSVSKAEIGGNETEEPQAEERDKWTPAVTFFGEIDHSQRKSLGVDRTSISQSEDDAIMVALNTPAKRQKSNDGTSMNQTPKFVTTINVDGAQTPMLPPRSTVKKTSSSKAPGKGAKITSKNPLPQPEEGMQGRASIARLRSQNAGMVLAKAKLFNELGSEVDKVKMPLPPTEVRRRSSVFHGKVDAHTEANNCYLVPYKNLLTQMPRERMSDVMSAKAARRKTTSKSPSHMQKRLSQKLGLSRQATQCRAAADIAVNIESVATNNGPVISSNSPTRGKSTPADSQWRNAPRIKKSVQVNSPKRYVKTSRGSAHSTGARRTPLKATPLGLRSSPRIKNLP